MKRIILISAVAAVMLSALCCFAGCFPMRQKFVGNGDLTNVVLDADGEYTKLAIKNLGIHNSGNLDVSVSVGEKPSVSLTASSNVLDEILSYSTMDNGEIEISGGSLYNYLDDITIEIIGLSFAKSDFEGNMTLLYDTDVPADISLSGEVNAVVKCGSSTETLKIRCSGNTDVEISGSPESLTAHCSGSTVMSISGNIKTVSIDASGSTVVRCRAADDVFSADSLEIRGSGDTEFDGGSFRSSDARVDSSGAGDYTVNATETLTVNFSGDNHLKYFGKPWVTQRLSGSSRVEPAD